MGQKTHLHVVEQRIIDSSVDCCIFLSVWI